jgi:hypothetical protein
MLKNGTKIEYTYAAGKVVAGRIIRAVRPQENYGYEGWYQVILTDEHGLYRGCVHREQIRNIDNRPQFAGALI